MGKLFGTDGVRGIANADLTCELAFKIGRAVAGALTGELKRKPKVVIGKDTRLSGDMLEASITAGLCSMGARAVELGVIPTPAVAYLTRKYEADAGIVISASHNSAEYNGIKIFNGNGYKLSDSIEAQIEDIVLKSFEKTVLPTGDDVGVREVCTTALKDYTDFAKHTIDCDLSGMKVAIDCANGAAYVTSVKAVAELGAEVFVVSNHPNGKNINLNCGSTHMEKFCEYVKNINVDIGISFDGDADRVLVSDEQGNVVDGDKLMLLCAEYMSENNMLNKNTLVSTVMTNYGLVKAAEEMGIRVVQTDVGDRYVLEKMLAEGYNLGGEQSGHIIFLDRNTTGDGLVSALAVLSIMKKTGRKISELVEKFSPLPQCTVNARVKNEKKTDYLKDEGIMAEIQKLENEFSGRGRVLIRPSGTEPYVRVMLEGDNIDEVVRKAGYLANLIEARLN